MDQRLARLHTWVINLDRAPERLARVRQQLEPQGLAWTRLSAVDARQLIPEQRALLDEAAYRRKHGMAPSLGELGCYLSHLEVMRALLASRHDFALVLEDDVVIGPALRDVLAALIVHQDRWDVVKLSAVHSGTPQPFLALTPEHALAVMLSQCTGSSAYLVNRCAAERYVQQLLPMQLPYDHVFDQGWRFGFKLRLVTPTPCGHGSDFESTIVTQPDRKFHGWRRWPTYAYRLSNELRRVRYGLAQTWMERRAGAGAAGPAP